MTWWVITVCLLIIPWLIIVLAIIEQIVEGALHPYFFFVAMNELGLIGWSLTLRSFFQFSYD